VIFGEFGDGDWLFWFGQSFSFLFTLKVLKGLVGKRFFGAGNARGVEVGTRF
jgi:hypothetical protein